MTILDLIPPAWTAPWVFGFLGTGLLAAGVTVLAGVFMLGWQANNTAVRVPLATTSGVALLAGLALIAWSCTSPSQFEWVAL